MVLSGEVVEIFGGPVESVWKQPTEKELDALVPLR